MGRQRKPLPKCFEVQGDQVRCKVCLGGDRTGEGRWIHYQSAQTHVSSAAHLTELDHQERREREKEEEAKRVQKIYNGPVASLNGPLELPQVYPRAGMYEGSSQMHGNVELEFESLSDIAPETSSRKYRLLDPDLVNLGIQPIPEHDPEDERTRLRQQIEELMQQAEHEDTFGLHDDDDDDITSTNVAQLFGDLDLEDEAAEEEVFDYFNKNAPDRNYFPYPNKIIMLLDILDNLPRLRMSSNQFRLILWLLKQCGVTNVPSYSGFREIQAELQKMCGSKPEKHVSTLGNVFYTNNIGESIAKDFANPEVAKHIHLYPEVKEGPISEVWQAERWREFKPSELTPMFSRNHRQFFIEEVTQLDDSSYVLPQNLVMRNGELTSDCQIIAPSTSGWTVSDETKVIPTSRFEFNYLDIVSVMPTGSIPWAHGVEVPAMPNALRKLAGDDDLVVVMLPLWCDDVSGNKSKQYNKHINVCTVNSNIPGRLLQQEYFVHFVSTSPNATSPEQFAAIKTQIEATHTNPLRCYNAHTHKNTRAIIRTPSLPADNPQQSEEASHIGGNGNCKCRTCRAGGSHEVTESNEGYHELYMTGLKRTAEGVREELKVQTKLAMYGVAKPILERQTSTGTKDKVAQYWIDILLTKAREMKRTNPSRSADDIADELQKWLDEQPGDKMNPLLSLAGLDPTQDTPVEILHTILLGIVKYAWYNLHSNWSEAQQDLFTIRLQSTDISGMTVPPIRAPYMMQYRNALIGKHFKTLMQTMPFHVHGIVSSAQFKLVKAIGELGSVLWVHEIEDMDQYLSDLEILIGNVLDAFAEVDPSKIIVKMKLHMLPHLIDDVKRYGPVIRNSTETFECFNAIFRLCSILSNHQAPSRDIAIKFASMDRLKHMLSGGYWLSEIEKGKFEWVQAGLNVREVLMSDSTIQRHLGWAPARQFTPGIIRFKGRKRALPLAWEDTEASKCATNEIGLAFPAPRLRNWRKGVSVTAQSGDQCPVGSWIILKDEQEKSHIGRLSEIIGLHDGSAASVGIVTVESFELGQERHPEFGLPVLQRPTASSKKRSAFLTKNVLFVFSVQHDCWTADCSATALRPQLQERQLTTRTSKLISHGNDDHFVVNLYGLHNTNLLRKFLPRDLARPIALHDDRKAFHFQVAATLHIQQSAKRAKTKEKKAATAAEKKAKKAAELAGKHQAIEPGSEDEMEPESEDEMMGELSDDAEDEGEGLTELCDEEREPIRGSKRKRRKVD